MHFRNSTDRTMGFLALPCNLATGAQAVVDTAACAKKKKKIIIMALGN